ncbi:MAG: hypothetical protein V4615_15625 [Bacteroidota bacterium]
MKKIVSVLSVLVLCSFNLPKEKFVSKEGGFSMEVPKNYRAEESTDAMVPVTIYSPKENDADDFIENISIVTQPFTGNADAYYNTYLLGILRLFKDYKLVDSGTKTINGQNAHWSVYTFTYGNYTAKVLAYYFSFNGKGYALTCSAKENTYDKYQKKFEAIAESFAKE